LETRINSDMLDAHNDFTVFGRFYPGDPLRIAVAASQKGFYLLENDGCIVRRQVVGHVQEVIPGRFVADVPGTQLMTNTLWESAGIYTLFDGRGNFLRRWELGVFSPMRRIEWPGYATDLLLLTDYDRRPALMDGAGKILWQADATRFGDWWRLPGQGVCEFVGRESLSSRVRADGDASPHSRRAAYTTGMPALQSNERRARFAVNYGRQLVIYGN
jgi:hypothetical protein